MAVIKNKIFEAIHKLGDKIKGNENESDKVLKTRSMSVRKDELISSLSSLKNDSVVGADIANTFAEVGILDKDFLNNLSDKQLVSLSDYVSSMCSLVREASIARTDEQVKYSTTINDYKEALKVCSGVFELYSVMAPLSPESLKDVFENLDNGKDVRSTEAVPQNVPSEQDLEIVRSFEMCGVHLDRDLKDGKWHLTKMDPLTLKSKSEPTNVFEEEYIENILDTYLNVPEENRGNVKIGPQAIFKSYISRANAQLQESASLQGKTGNVFVDGNESYWQIELSNLKRNSLNVGSEDWEIATLTDTNNINRMAQKEALKGIFKEKCNGLALPDDQLNSPVFSDELYDRLSEEPAGNSREQRKRLSQNLERLENITELAVDDIGVTFQDFTQFENMEERYNNLINNLQLRKDSLTRVNTTLDISNLDDNIAKLKDARAMFRASVDFQRSYIDQQIQAAPNTELSDRILIASSESANGYRIVMENGALKLEGNDMNPEVQQLFDAIKDKYIRPEAQNSATRTGGTPTNDASEAEGAINDGGTLPNIALDFVMSMSDDQNFTNNFNDYIKLQICQQFFKEGQPLALALADYLSKPENNGKTAYDFIDEIETDDPNNKFFGKEVMRAAYENTMVAEGKMANDARKKESVDLTNSLSQNFDETMVYMDRVIKSLTPDEISGLGELTSEQRQDLYRTKFNAVKNNPITPEELKESKMRHSNGVLANVIARGGYIQTFNALENEISAEEGLGKDGIQRGFTASLDNYITELLNGQDRNNQVLLNNGQPIVDYKKDLQNQQTKAPNSNGPKEKKFDEIYPSSPDSDLFNKKMKPFPGKEIAKHFLKPLLKAIAHTKINMEAYEARKNGGNNGPTEPQGDQINPDDVNPDVDAPDENAPTDDTNNITVPVPDEATIENLIRKEASKIYDNMEDDGSTTDLYGRAEDEARAKKDELIKNWQKEMLANQIEAPVPDEATVENLIRKEAGKIYDSMDMDAGTSDVYAIAENMARGKQQKLIEEWQKEQKDKMIEEILANYKPTNNPTVNTPTENIATQNSPTENNSAENTAEEPKNSAPEKQQNTDEVTNEKSEKLANIKKALDRKLGEAPSNEDVKKFASTIMNTSKYQQAFKDNPLSSEEVAFNLNNIQFEFTSMVDDRLVDVLSDLVNSAENTTAKTTPTEENTAEHKSTEPEMEDEEEDFFLKSLKDLTDDEDMSTYKPNPQQPILTEREDKEKDIFLKSLEGLADDEDMSTYKPNPQQPILTEKEMTEEEKSAYQYKPNQPILSVESKLKEALDNRLGPNASKSDLKSFAKKLLDNSEFQNAFGGNPPSEKEIMHDLAEIQGGFPLQYNPRLVDVLLDLINASNKNKTTETPESEDDLEMS